MEDCLHTSSENLSKLVSWAHSHGTICNLIPNLKHLLTEDSHGNLTAMWGCSAGHAYHWPLTATCKMGPKERACYQDSRSITSDSLSLQGGSGLQPSPGDRFLGRVSKGKGDCGQTRDSCDFSNCSEPSEVDDNTEDYNSNLFDIVCESSATDEDGDYDPRPQSTSRSALRKRLNPGAAACRQRLEEMSSAATVKKIKQEVPEDYYIVANAQLPGGLNGGPMGQSPKQTSQAYPPYRSSHAAPHKPPSSDADPIATTTSSSGTSTPSMAKALRAPAPGGQGRPQVTVQSPGKPDPLHMPLGSQPCGPSQNSMTLQLAGHGEPPEPLPAEDLVKSCGTFGDTNASPARVNPELEIIGTEPKAEASVMGLGDGALASFIASVLPNLRGHQPVLEVLKTLGVEDLEDMKYVQEADLISVLWPIEARKLIAHVNTTGGCVAETPYSPQSSSSPSSTPRRQATLDNDWHFHFQIPWDKMPTEVIGKLKNNERPKKSERLEMIRLIVREVLIVCPTPGKRHLREIARKMVVTYPSSFKDVIEGEIVGSGYDSLTKQLMSKVDNCKRGNNPLALKRRASNTREGEAPKRMRLDSYGCVNWLPDKLPPRETNESQKRTQEELKNMYADKSNDDRSIKKKMAATFYTQRKDIIGGMEVCNLEKEWPYLFETLGMKTHFKEVTGVDVNKEAMTSKSERVVSYLLSREKISRTEVVLAEMKVAKEKHLEANLPGSLLLLLNYFNEEVDQMFRMVDETCLPSEVDCTKLPRTPCIIVCGSSPVTAERFMISVDQTIVNGSITNFSDALLLMFGPYYCLNISYPAALGTTLEFLQRCLFKINPDKGSKVERGSRKQAVNPKVLSMISRIADFEWRE